MSPFGDSAVWVQRWNGSPLMNGAGFAGNADRQQHLAVERAFAHGVVAVVGAVEIVVGSMCRPCARENRPSPQVRRKLPSRSNTTIGWSPRLKT